MGWPLKAGGSLQSLAFKVTRRYFTTESFCRVKKESVYLLTRRLLIDICRRTFFSISYHKSPPDREEGPVGP